MLNPAHSEHTKEEKMATIRQLESGKWQAVVRKKGQPKKYKSFATKKDAETWAVDLEAKMNRGTFNDLSEAEALTIREGLKKYLEEITPKKRGCYQEANRIKRLMENKKLSDKSFATLKPFDVAKYRDDMGREGLSPSTINKQLSIISHLFEVALKDWGIHCINPVKQITKPKVNNSRDRRLSPVEEKYLMAALEDASADVFTKFKSSVSRNRNTEVIRLVQFAIETAMRKAEPFQLTWADVDFEKRVVTLRETKNGKSREVPLSPRAIEILKNGEDGGNVVKIRKGKVFKTTYSALTQSFNRAIKRAQRMYARDVPGDEQVEGFLVDFTYHDLRHEATSRLAEVFEMHELMKITGHSDSRMLNRYNQQDMGNAALKLEQHLAKKQSSA